MLMHCLTVKFKESASPEEIEVFHAALAALPEQTGIPLSTRLGRDIGERPTNAHFGLVTEFASVEDFYRFLNHPAHQAVNRDAVESFNSVQFLLDE